MNSRSTYNSASKSASRNSFIRGVNVGGWLLLERFITPYMFALTDCHTNGDFCWYPGQISAPPLESRQHQYCDMYQCKFSLDKDNAFPVDEYTLTSKFSSKAIAREYLSYHWDNFVTKQDVQTLHRAGITHVRVPIPHWIMGDILEDEPWVDGQWLYFVRFVGWCREYGIEVWPDIHTAPGSQNGFDNSGQLLPDSPTCQHWANSEEHVQRSLQAIRDISDAIVRDNLEDVVTGFGVLNEPFADCDRNVVKQFYNEALKTIRETLGEETAVYIGDLFNATDWNNGWWTDEDTFTNTFLDSHYYQVFDGRHRSLSPKQHIALACEKGTQETNSCCYEDAPSNTVPSRGISRLVGEWSAAFDTEPKYKLYDVMESIRTNMGDAPASFLNGTMSQERKTFMKNFVEAQMVVYEATNTSSLSSKDGDGIGVSRGWFYWTLKTEFGAFAEWDFLQGYIEGWIPTLPPPTETSESIFGTCREIATKTIDDESIINEFPDPKSYNDLWYGPEIKNEYVLTHAGSRTKEGKLIEPIHDELAGAEASSDKGQGNQNPSTSSSSSFGREKESSEDMSISTSKSGTKGWFPLLFIGFFGWAVWKVFLNEPNFMRNRRQYRSVDSPTHLYV